jgi:hypothetical protein
MIAMERFLNKVQRINECWIWGGQVDEKGYGRFHDNGKKHYAHRWFYEKSVGPISEGLELDHLCRNRACVRLEHLEPVTHQMNVKRGVHGTRQRAMTECKRGHEFIPENTRVTSEGKRQCRACDAARHRSAASTATDELLGKESRATKSDPVHVPTPDGTYPSAAIEHTCNSLHPGSVGDCLGCRIEADYR